MAICKSTVLAESLRTRICNPTVEHPSTQPTPTTECIKSFGLPEPPKAEAVARVCSWTQTQPTQSWSASCLVALPVAWRFPLLMSTGGLISLLKRAWQIGLAQTQAQHTVSTTRQAIRISGQFPIQRFRRFSIRTLSLGMKGWRTLRPRLGETASCRCTVSGTK